MTYEFKLPDIGEGVVEGEVVRWLVSDGEMVREDQPLVEIMTDKATVEIPAPKAGRIGKRMYAEGQICPVGKILVTIETDAVAAPASPGSSHPSKATPEKKTTPETPAVSVADAVGLVTPNRDASGPSSSGVLATPATRKLARDLGLDIGRVRGSGRAGRITSEDVQAHQTGTAASGAGLVSARASTAGSSGQPVGGAIAFPPPKHEVGDVRLPFRGVRKKIAERLVHSKQTAAHFTYVEEIDCTDLVAARAQANQRLSVKGVKLSYLPFIISATVAALEKFPQLNATLDEHAGEIVQRASRHIGLATATDSGLIVPVIRDAGRKSLVELGAEIERLADVTRSGKATREDLSGSTFTITSLGALGGLLATPIINFPEVAILGVHKIAKRPAAVGDRIELRDLMNLSISVDHRVVDGYDAARFIAEIKARLENPGHFLLALGELV